MTYLIDKDALVAEIEKRLDELYNLLPDASKVENGSITISEVCNTGKYTELESFRRFLDTLEVKEVDLEKAIDDYIYTHEGRKRLALELDWKYCNLTLKGSNEIIKFAKHFFELGLKAQKGEEQ